DTTTYQTAWAVASCVIFPCGPRRQHASAPLSAGSATRLPREGSLLRGAREHPPSLESPRSPTGLSTAQEVSPGDEHVSEESRSQTTETSYNCRGLFNVKTASTHHFAPFFCDKALRHHYVRMTIWPSLKPMILAKNLSGFLAIFRDVMSSGHNQADLVNRCHQ